MSKYLVFSMISVVLLTGCSDITGCKVKTQIIEAEFASPFYDIALDNVEDWKKLGYSCPSESIRNGNGQVIGTKFTCTKCD